MKRITVILTALMLLLTVLSPSVSAEEAAQPMAKAISVASLHTLILLEDGTVAAAGENAYGQLDVSSWRDIVGIASGMSHSVGLKADGTVVAAGDNEYGQCDVADWKNIVQVACMDAQTFGLDAAGNVHSAGRLKPEAGPGSLTGVRAIHASSGGWAALMKDGTVRGSRGYQTGGAEEWQGVEKISGQSALIGLLENGSSVITGINQRLVEGVTDAVDIANNDMCGLILHKNGTVTGLGRDKYGMTEVDEWTGVIAVGVGYCHSVGLRADGTVLTASSSDLYGACEIPAYLRPSREALLASFPRSDKKVIALDGGGFHTLLLMEDGTVRAFGRNNSGQCDVEGWTDIVAVAGGSWFSVGLRADGTVVAAGENGDGQCDVQDWKNIVAIAAGGHFTLGLDADGVVHAAGLNNYGQADIDGLSGVAEICAGYLFSAARMKDGTFCTFGANDYGSRELTGWSDVIRMAAGDFNTLGLHPDGTVIAAGRSNNGQISVDGLRDICGIACGTYHCVYLHADGTVTAMGKNEYGEINTENWRGVTAVAAGAYHTLGLFADGTVLATGGNEYGQCDVPKEFVNLGDMATYSPNWHFVWDNYFYGAATDTGWPRGFVVWESKEGSTSYGVNNGGFMDINGWEGTVFSVNREKDGSVSFINVIQMNDGNAVTNTAFFADGSCTYLDWTQTPAVRYLYEAGVIRLQEQVNGRWKEVRVFSPDDPEAADIPLYTGFSMRADEQQSSRLHYGSYVVDVTDDAGNTVRLLDLQVDREGSVLIRYDGHVWQYDVRTERYTHQ